MLWKNKVENKVEGVLAVAPQIAFLCLWTKKGVQFYKKYTLKLCMSQ